MRACFVPSTQRRKFLVKNALKTRHERLAAEELVEDEEEAERIL